MQLLLNIDMNFLNRDGIIQLMRLESQFIKHIAVCNCIFIKIKIWWTKRILFKFLCCWL